MKILIISHNVFSNNESMGRTLSSFFENWNNLEIAQLYFHSQVPTTHICENYYSVTDKDILKSIFTRKSGTLYRKENINESRPDSRTDEGLIAAIYQKGRKRTPLIFALRNTAWKLGKWNTSKLKAWLDEFNPEAVFFASGDYSFSYDIALKIAKSRNIPLIISCMDDYYFFNHNQKRFLGNISHKNFMRHVKKTMNYASAITCICDKMTHDYQNFFHKPCYTLHTASSFDRPLQENKKQQISYIGNLSYDRYLQLIKIGTCLKKMNLQDGPHFLTVYSAEPRKEILSHMTMENGIDFRGAINAQEVKKVMSESLAVVHTESFDQVIANMIRYSVSTKIADSLMSGTCIFAFGPKDVASIEYLINNNAAIVATSDDSLEEHLKELIINTNLRKQIESNAVQLALKNHSKKAKNRIFKEFFINL